MAQKKIHDSPSTRVMAYRKRRMEGMKRVEIWLTDEELTQLDKVVEATGISRARVVAQLLQERKAPPVIPTPPLPPVLQEAKPVQTPNLSRAQRGQNVFLASLLTLKKSEEP
ncbi:MAG: hypothetical protein HQL94_05465 [Magnetococcales bacterium]|nr:hypothetical protein [Magnetococcales bacterium]MBF0437926.1 hypothetical protein [Magnetococcales bacterium]